MDFDLATRRANNVWTKTEDNNDYIKQEHSAVDQTKNNKAVDVKDDIKNVSDDSSYLLSIEDIDGDASVDTRKKRTSEKVSNKMITFKHKQYNEQKPMEREEEKQQVREEISPPDRGAFDKFIKEIVVQKFEKQRRWNQKQFAVLLLVSEEQWKDLHQMNFYPSQPLTDSSRLSMPACEKDYQNYIVARPENDDLHAEAVIFEKLDQLWKGYLSHNGGTPPKCFILYSWNFPCTKCTKLIINSFNKWPYRAVSVVVAATAFWDKEEHEVRHENEGKMEQERFYVSYHRGINLYDPRDHLNTYSSDSDDAEASWLWVDCGYYNYY